MNCIRKALWLSMLLFFSQTFAQENTVPPEESLPWYGLFTGNEILGKDCSIVDSKMISINTYGWFADKKGDGFQVNLSNNNVSIIDKFSNYARSAGYNAVVGFRMATEFSYDSNMEQSGTTFRLDGVQYFGDGIVITYAYGSGVKLKCKNGENQE